MTSFSFYPSPARTAEIDLAIRQALADSLKTIGRGVVDAGLSWPGDIEAWCRLLLEARRAPPQLWCRYHDIVRSIVREDVVPLALADSLMSLLPAPAPRPGSVVTISRESLGEDAGRYRAVVDSDPDNGLDLRPATSADMARIAGLETASRGLMVAVAPDLLDEIDTLGHQIVLATNSGPRRFGGAASVFLWGAVILNPSTITDRVTLVESLAHETAHALLFGLTLGADLTTNDPGERYGSPLRPDPRPIEGIVHATYVLARMVFALDQIGGSGRLGADERVDVRRRIERNLANYEAGLRTVGAHARFTDEGAAIFDACRTAMDDRSRSCGGSARP